MGRRHIAAAGQAEGVELVAVCDPVPGAAEAAAPPGVATAPGLDELGEPVAAVVIAAPTPFHTSLAEQAIGMGLDVLSEKPVGFDPGAIERLGERAAEAGRVLAVGFWRRTAWPYVEARRLVAEGAIGTPTFLRSSQWDADLPPLAFADPEVSGGVEVDCGVHEADLARWFLGCEIAQVSATGTPGALAEVGDAETCRGPGRHHRRPGRRDRPGPNLRLRRRRPHRDPGARRRAPDRRSRPRWAAPRRPVRPARRPRPRRRRPRAGARRSARTVCRGMPGCGAARDGDRRRPRARGRAGDAPLAPGGRRRRGAHEHCHVSLRRSVRTARCSWFASLQQFRAGGKGRTWYLLGPGSGACAALAVARTMEPPRVAPEDVPTSSRW